MTVQLPVWRGPTATVPVEHARAPWLAAVGSFIVTYLVLAAIAFSRTSLFPGDQDGRYSNWAYQPVLAASVLSFALSVVTLLPFASSRLPVWARAVLVGMLAVATVPAVASAVVVAHSREAISGRLMDEARALVPPAGAVPAREPQVQPGLTDRVAHLSSPDVRITWTTSPSTACDVIATYTHGRPGWQYSQQFCSAKHRQGEVAIVLAGPPVASDDKTIQVDVIPND